MPTAPQTAFAFGPAPANQADFTAIADFTGQPATAFPAGVTNEGLPLSCQVVTPDDAQALALARKLALPTPAPPDFRG
jgi:aspartyl-tRNA(Asn)/glutamyl-tRNA(Gln) amidotransferase subunit A